MNEDLEGLKVVHLRKRIEISRVVSNDNEQNLMKEKGVPAAPGRTGS